MSANYEIGGIGNTGEFMNLRDFYWLVCYVPRRIKAREYAYWLDEQFGGDHWSTWKKTRESRGARKLDKMLRKRG